MQVISLSRALLYALVADLEDSGLSHAQIHVHEDPKTPSCTIRLTEKAISSGSHAFCDLEQSVDGNNLFRNILVLDAKVHKFEIPNVSLEMIQTQHIDAEIYNPNEVELVLKANGYNFLGWLNSGISVPDNGTYVRVYKNYSGSYTICADHENKQYYCVDMGD